MKVVLRSSSFLAMLLGSKANASVSDAPPLLQRGFAGGVRIGMPAVGLKVPRRELSIEAENGVVTAIRVHSRRYKTETGIGIGDTLIKLANQYPMRWNDDHEAEVDELKMKFQVKDDRIVSILIS
jgi:hypothetical protein